MWGETCLCTFLTHVISSTHCLIPLFLLVVLKHFSSAGNQLTCDCRLSWIHVLRNETKSEPLRLALDDVTCVPNKPNDTPTNEISSQTNAEKKENQLEVAANSDVFQQDANDEESYEEASPAYKYEATVSTVTFDQVVLLDMPIEALACRNELSQNGEDSLMLSSKDESYWRPSSSFRILSNLSLVLTFVTISSLIEL